MFLPLTLVTILVLLVYIYFNTRFNKQYWKRRGAAFDEDHTFGVFWEFVRTDRPLFEIFSGVYKKYENEPAVGLASFGKPTVFVTDISNVEHVLHLDFKSFNHRGIDVTEDDKLTNSILFLNGKKWKLLRQSMTPLFTAAKLKNMYYIMDRSGRDFVDYLNKHPEKLNSDTFDTLTTFCCAAIVASVFGLGTESIFDSPLLETSRKALQPTLRSNLKFSLLAAAPSLFKTLKLKLFGEHEDFFISVIKQVIRQREKENVKKHDFVDLCVDLQKKGILHDPETDCELVPTDELMAAQAFFYLIAGVEPSATAMFSTLIELGMKPNIVQRVQDEIDAAFEGSGGSITYDDLSKMELLDNVLSEGMRMYPPVGFLTRRCVQDTVLPVGTIKIDKGTNIFTPLFDIHRDPKYFPNPDVFDPDRFSDSAQNIAFMAFGKGSRQCIGARFTRLQIKTGFLYLLRNFTPRSEIIGEEIVFKKLQFQVRPDNVNVQLIPRAVKTIK